jgi:hypothetical protein
MFLKIFEKEPKMAKKRQKNAKNLTLKRIRNGEFHVPIRHEEIQSMF